MFKKDLLKERLGQISAKTLSLGGKQFVLGRNEQKIKYSEAYEYTPLSGTRSFRLLRIFPGADTDFLSVELSEADLDTKPIYEALSYTWDLDPKLSVKASDLDIVESEKGEKRPILCNGKTLHITMNLYNALCQFRQMKRDTLFWADQVCINQDDNREKTRQLAIMTQIYESASIVIVWLGTLNAFRSWALDSMEALGDHSGLTVEVPSTPQPQTSKVSRMSRPFETITSISNSLVGNSRWLAIIMVLGRQWFRRVWTLQELMLAKSFQIMMGHREIQPSAIARATTQLFEFYATDPLAAQVGAGVTMNSLRGAIQQRAKMFVARDAYQNGKRYSAEEYLLIVRMRRATVPKDRVFAGAALFDNGAPHSVDYSSTTRDIYCAFASERVWSSSGVNSLSLIGGAAPNIEGLPSWVPDLSTTMRPKALRHCGGSTFQPPTMSPTKAFRIDGSTLHLNAKKWDSVKQVGESLWSWIGFDDEAYNSDPRVKMVTSTAASQERFGLMFGFLNDLGSTYAPTGERTTEAFWKTLIGGTTVATTDTTLWQDRFNHYFAFTLLKIRSDLHSAKKCSSSSKPWLVPLIQDLPRLEERVSLFLDAHDQPVGDGELPNQPLKKVISVLTSKVWGADVDDEAKRWKNPFDMGNLLTAFKNDGTYRNISAFGDLFETIYDGRRIFLTDNGFLGISTEAVHAGDQVFLVAGADTPYVFRSAEGKEATYTLVGEAYMHGLTSDSVFSSADSAFDDIRIL